MATLALRVVLSCWAAFAICLAVNHVRVRRRRGAEKGRDQKGELRAPESMLGLAIEGVAVALVFTQPESWPKVSHVAAAVAMLLSTGSVALLAAALRHLGRHWRIKAVVTEDHELVTTGPYSVVRHPVLLSLFALTVASGLLLAPPGRLVAAVALYIAGTEIRVRAEERLLRRRFGAAFDAYRSRVAAYLPFIR